MGGSWQRLAVGGWRRLAVGGWRLVVLGGGCWLVVSGWLRLAVGRLGFWGCWSLGAVLNKPPPLPSTALWDLRWQGWGEK